MHLSDPFFDLFSDVLEKSFWHYISMNYGVCINFGHLALIWPYFGPYEYLYHKNHKLVLPLIQIVNNSRQFSSMLDAKYNQLIMKQFYFLL